MSKQKKILLFVYGTLKKDNANSFMLDSSDFLGKAVTVKHMYMLSFGCPAVILPISTGIDELYINMEPLPILGELYKISKRTFKFIDNLEGYPDLYDRSLQSVTFGDNKAVKAYIYTIKMENADMYLIGNTADDGCVQINNKRYEYKYTHKHYYYV